VPIGTRYKVFDIELVAITTVLEWALDRHFLGPIYILLDT
jgi:hypothetical protein